MRPVTPTTAKLDSSAIPTEDVFQRCPMDQLACRITTVSRSSACGTHEYVHLHWTWAKPAAAVTNANLDCANALDTMELLPPISAPENARTIATLWSMEVIARLMINADLNSVFVSMDPPFIKTARWLDVHLDVPLKQEETARIRPNAKQSSAMQAHVSTPDLYQLAEHAKMPMSVLLEEIAQVEYVSAFSMDNASRITTAEMIKNACVNQLMRVSVAIPRPPIMTSKF
eukprot:TRINITY_DN6207_c0_g1_i1.p2 TRINITY_DN6207_c0_g1~~TRINITY_DN6207_c0_g1_i1.p2  ORF type:complete len:229 (+),score=26.87 TRINITY_DN6207_c0_g1_i1:523-1209(+)